MLIGSAPGALLWPAAMIVWGPGSVSSAHAHHCVQLLMAVDGALRIRAGAQEAWVECGAALVRPDAPHEVETLGRTLLIAFVEPESALGAALVARAPRAITVIGADEVERWRARLGGGDGPESARVERWVREDLLAGGKPPRLHPGVRRALRFARQRLADADALPLAQVATVAGLSTSRFGHVFTESVGAPWRRYLLWLRLQRACGELVRGASATQAAHRAGFSDAAHMSRTFRRMLGATPQELSGRRGMVQGVSVSAGDADAASAPRRTVDR